MKNPLKIPILILGLICLSQMLSAQTVSKGAWMVGGSAGFSSTKYKVNDKSTTTILFAPNLAYYFANDFAVGLDVGFLSTSYNGTTNSNTSLGPYLRYYVTDPIFIQVGANFGLKSGAGTGFGAAVGYSWFLNNGLAIEPAIFFNSFNNDGDALDYTTFGLGIGVQGFAHHDHGKPF